MNNELNTSFDATWGCWIAYISDCPENSGTIGEGNTRENAIADYWVGVHGNDAATLLEPAYTDGYHWKLQDCRGYSQTFDTREEAVAFAESNQYLTNPLIRKV